MKVLLTRLQLVVVPGPINLASAMQMSSDTAVQPCEVREVMWMAARVELGYRAACSDVLIAVDDPTIKTPQLIGLVVILWWRWSLTWRRLHRRGGVRFALSEGMEVT